jgi:hypothetical protein
MKITVTLHCEGGAAVQSPEFEDTPEMDAIHAAYAWLNSPEIRDVDYVVSSWDHRPEVV